MREAEILSKSGRRRDNVVRPYASLGHRPPAREAFVPGAYGMAGGASRSSFASDAPAGAPIDPQLTCVSDHRIGADQLQVRSSVAKGIRFDEFGSRFAVMR